MPYSKCPTDTTRWFALIRIWSPWLAPRQGKSTFGLDKEAVTASFLSLTGKHLVLLGISGVGDVMTLFTSDSDGNVVLRVGLPKYYLKYRLTSFRSGMIVLRTQLHVC
jgi:hypothetical protein